ncbi:jg5847 [Pararge aegeria aegeria]|uniref:Jg5847 protein n=1 Tax=Pararge aegeria aegeria TaxID=348720 RepID=A0A8S4SHC3_9NEOP|nr:jg5847 [Pararge aegeria aegeria]
MPPSKEQNSKSTYSRSFSNNEMTMSAKVYHPATNLMPPTPPHSPTGVSQTFPFRPNTNTWSRQNSQNNGKYH